MRARRLCVLGAAVAGLSACDGPQSAFAAAGRDAAHIAHLYNVMTVGALIVWAAVVGLAVYIVRVRQRPGATPGGQRAADLLVVGGGVAAPIIVLGALIAYGMPLLPEVLKEGSAGGLSIHVTAKQWWWRVEYQTPGGPVETANELRLPVGERVELRLSSPDVIHSFWVPALAGKTDMIPGRVTRIALEPIRTGTFRGVCAEYCGASHALMAFSVVVAEPEGFRAWLEAQARPAAAAAGSTAVRGAEAFIEHGCGACHTIRGTTAAAKIGPDLTHVASRIRIGAETLPNEPAAVVRWIGQTDRVKPGVHMPAFRNLDGDELSALAAYLGSLK